MSENTVITLKLGSVNEQKLYNAFQETAVTPPQYAKWQLRPENCVITCYTSGKTVFQGKDAKVYASPFGIPDVPKKSSKPVLSDHNLYPQAGSDEVGTGDYFGPVCVCAAIVRKEDLALLDSLGVRDSKQVRDEDIRKIAPELMKHLHYSLLIVNNVKYNEVHETVNLNAMKAMLHNQAYLNLAKKVPLPSFRVVDQFAPEATYYRYLRKVPKAVRGIHFETKAEDKYPAVGSASIIARYAYLKSMDQLEETYDMKLQKGAGPAVDACAEEFVKRYGFERLHEVAKMHFKNTGKLRK
jgi:ribonuclease HIII